MMFMRSILQDARRRPTAGYALSGALRGQGPCLGLYVISGRTRSVSPMESVFRPMLHVNLAVVRSEDERRYDRGSSGP